jgi:alpha-N-arabinofuranosidase
VNVIGAIKTTRTAAETETTGLVLQLYRAHFGQSPLRLEQDFAPCDIAAALTRDGKTVTVGVMNPTDAEINLRPLISGVMPTGAISRWHISGPSATAHNTPGKSREVDIRRTLGILPFAGLRVPPLGCAVFSLPLD